MYDSGKGVREGKQRRMTGCEGSQRAWGWGGENVVARLSIMSTILMPIATDDLLNIPCSDGATCHAQRRRLARISRKVRGSEGARVGRGGSNLVRNSLLRFARITSALNP